MFRLVYFASCAATSSAALDALEDDPHCRLVGRAVARSIQGVSVAAMARLNISEIANDRINVPFELRPSFDAALARFETRIAIGRRFEPWLEQVTVLSHSPTK